MEKMTGEEVMAIAIDQIEIHKHHPKSMNIDSPCNDHDKYKTQYTSGNFLFGNTYVN